MKFHYILIISFRFILLLLPGTFLSGIAGAQDKPEGKIKAVSVTLKVVDENGTPIQNANVLLGEGLTRFSTDENGACSFMAFPDKYLTVSATGFDKKIMPVQELIPSGTISLIKTKLFMSSDDNIPLPYGTLKKRLFTGSSNVITGSLLEKYPSTDIRNAFTGLIPGLQITEYDGSPGISAEEKSGRYNITEKIGVSARGYNMTYIIDDIPVDITQYPLDPSEIESVTVIKDIVGKAMFGPIGAGGIIFIKTRRGRTNEDVINVNSEYGVSTIDRFPEWVSGADYVGLNNQARLADGLLANYDNNDIAQYAKNDSYDMYHPSVNFRDMLLKNTRSFRRANVSSRGGNDVIKYRSYLGYAGEGDIYELGGFSGYDRISTRSNIDMQINDNIGVKFDIYGGLTIRRSPNYGYTSTTGEGGTQMDINEISSVLRDIISVPPTAFPVYANNDPSLADPWYAVTPAYPSNPVGNIMGNGHYYETGRTGSVSATFDYNFKNIIKGMKSRTLLNFNGLDLLRIGKAEDYIAYVVTPTVSSKTGNDTIILSKAHDGVSTPNLSKLHDYFYQRITAYENLSYENSFGPHDIQSSLTYFNYRISQDGIEEPQREQSAVLTGRYSYNDKYILQVVLNYAGTYSFAKDKRSRLFPSAGIGWVMSEENFMSKMKFINYLKLRAEAGILGYETFLEPFLFRDDWTVSTGANFGPYSTDKWFGPNNETSPYRAYPSRTGNPALTWEKSKEFNIGLDAVMADGKISIEINYYNNLRDNQIIRLTSSIPLVTGISNVLPRYNYNSTRYFGAETGIQFADKAGKFEYSFGANASVQNSKIEKYDEPQYRFDYQFRTGKAADTYWGLTYLGKFANDAEALEIPQIYDAVLKQGDLKYMDMNDDGIVDDNDQSALGHTSPGLYYALNARLKYHNFEMTVIGTGSAFYDLPLTNAYYWNGWGDNNYSNFVKENIGGSYPRLTYYKLNNNLVNSDFWLSKGGYFKIQNIELAYTIPASNLQMIRSQGIRFFMRGANLLTITKVKDVDPESINSGVTVYPLYRTFTGGINLTF